MRTDRRDLLNVLKAELTFLDLGGYSRQLPAGARPTLIFEDSPTCINCGRRDDPVVPCAECVLIDLVPAGCRSKQVPCRHIPLNRSGDTLDSLYKKADPGQVEESVRKWLCATINRLERKRSGRQ